MNLRKLRIAMFGWRGIPHTYGGAETLLWEPAPRLAARGHEMLACSGRSLFKDRPRTHRGVGVTYLSSIETKVLGTPTHTLLCTLDMLFRKVDVALV